jgi:hypothetical protein
VVGDIGALSIAPALISPITHRQRACVRARALYVPKLPATHGASRAEAASAPCKITRSAAVGSLHQVGSQADSTGSIPVTRSTREKCCRSWGFVKSISRSPSGWARSRAPRMIRERSAGAGSPVSTGLPGGFSARSEDGQGRHQLLGRLEQPLRVLNGSLCFGIRGGLSGPSGVLEFVSSSSHGAKGPEPIAELGTKSHLDCIVST